MESGKWKVGRWGKSSEKYECVKVGMLLFTFVLLTCYEFFSWLFWAKNGGFESILKKSKKRC